MRGVPAEQPHTGMVATGEVNAGNLQVASVNIALVQRDITIEGNALVGAATHGIIITMTGVHRREIRRANQSIETVSGIAKK